MSLNRTPLERLEFLLDKEKSKPSVQESLDVLESAFLSDFNDLQRQQLFSILMDQAPDFVEDYCQDNKDSFSTQEIVDDRLAVNAIDQVEATQIILKLINTISNVDELRSIVDHILKQQNRLSTPLIDDIWGIRLLYNFIRVNTLCVRWWSAEDVAAAIVDYTDLYDDPYEATWEAVAAKYHLSDHHLTQIMERLDNISEYLNSEVYATLREIVKDYVDKEISSDE